MSADRLDALDYYDLLGVEPGASADAVRRAFHDFARRYHPDRFAAAAESKRERAAEIYRRGAEAYRVLMSYELRARYDAGLARGERRLTPESEARPASTGKLVVRSAKARPFVTKALLAYKSGDYKTARLNLKLAVGHEPDNELLRARLAEVEQRLATG